MKANLQSGTQGSNSLVDAHRAISMMQIDRFVENNGENDITSRKFVSVLNATVKMDKNFAELV